MSEVKRYDLNGQYMEMRECEDGDYVKFEDYQKLKAQLEMAEEVLEHYKSYCVPQWVEVPGMNGMRGVQEIWLAREYFKEKEQV